jgi:hypothetical protein
MRGALLIALLACACSCQGPTFKPFDGPKLILVFIESDPWLNVIGSDNPRVAVYETGEVIFLKAVNGKRIHHTVKLDTSALEDLRSHLAPLVALKNLKSHYNVNPNVTDQPTSMFYIRQGGKAVATRVYGLMAPETEPGSSFRAADGRAPDKVPTELLQLHARLCSLDFAKRIEWTPQYLEVMLWDYSYAPEESIHWPKEWPSLDSARAIKRGDSYSIFLDANLLPQLRDFLATEKDKGAVEVGGKKLAAAYRFAFPSEPIWRQAFDTTTVEGE